MKFDKSLDKMGGVSRSRSEDAVHPNDCGQTR
jgi:hypothetical protein